MDEVKERVRCAELFYKIDLKDDYHLFRIKAGDEWKAAFGCQYVLLEYTVMTFGLSNAPTTVQVFINHIFRDMIDHKMSAFQDDIILCSEMLAGLHNPTCEVLSRIHDKQHCIANAMWVWAHL